MGLDIRLPIGLMFALIGVVLTVYGAITNSDTQLYQRSLSININLWWGIFMLIFGLVMIFLGRSGRIKQGVHPAQESLQGELTENYEHKKGLEH